MCRLVCLHRQARIFRNNGQHAESGACAVAINYSKQVSSAWHTPAMMRATTGGLQSPTAGRHRMRLSASNVRMLGYDNRDLNKRVERHELRAPHAQPTAR